MNSDIASSRGTSKLSTSGRFLLRLSPGLHALLRQAAADAHLSLNDYCNLKLSAPVGSLTGDQELARAVIHAATALEADLIAVVAFGSWCRGEQTPDSDLDLLIVIEETVPINRTLYRRWDELNSKSRVRALDPHFVHPPWARVGITGVWAEVALEGIVLFERGLELSRYLVEVRREILRGQLVQKWVHGQRYWLEVA